MYKAFYGLKERPFGKTPDPRFLYMAPQYDEALARLQYAVEEREIAVLTGEIGSGKTTLSRALMDQNPNDHTVLIVNPRLTPTQLLRELALRLDVTPGHYRADLVDALSDRLQDVFRNLRGEARLTEANVESALREIRLALLEADVNFRVVKDFVARVRERAVGQDVLESLNAGQMVIKIVHEELTAILGAGDRTFHLSGSPAVVLLVGLQGSGKTTTAAKLARQLVRQGRRPLLVAADPYRPAAAVAAESSRRPTRATIRGRARARTTETQRRSRRNPTNDLAGGLELLHPLTAEGHHVLLHPEVEAPGRAGLDAGRLEPLADAVGAQRALVDLLGQRVELRDGERASRHAVLAADAILLLEVDDAVRVLDERARRGARAQAGHARRAASERFRLLPRVAAAGHVRECSHQLREAPEPLDVGDVVPAVLGETARDGQRFQRHGRRRQTISIASQPRRHDLSYVLVSRRVTDVGGRNRHRDPFATPVEHDADLRRAIACSQLQAVQRPSPAYWSCSAYKNRVLRQDAGYCPALLHMQTCGLIKEDSYGKNYNTPVESVKSILFSRPMALGASYTENNIFLHRTDNVPSQADRPDAADLSATNLHV